MQGSRLRDHHRKQREINRITSYNVCYTKLLRFAHIFEGVDLASVDDEIFDLLASGMLQEWLKDPKGVADALGLDENELSKIRITSYNVCYTKLLRFAHFFF